MGGTIYEWNAFHDLPLTRGPCARAQILNLPCDGKLLLNEMKEEAMTSERFTYRDLALKQNLLTGNIINRMHKIESIHGKQLCNPYET